MKIKFHKAKHFWKDGQSATWIRSDFFGDRYFNKLKQQYEELKYSKVKYIQVDKKTIFLFYNLL